MRGAKRRPSTCVHRVTPRSRRRTPAKEDVDLAVSSPAASREHPIRPDVSQPARVKRERSTRRACAHLATAAVSPGVERLRPCRPGVRALTKPQTRAARFARWDP